jgi:hypothetical protein
MLVRVFDEYGALNSKDVFSAFKSGLYENGDAQTKNMRDADVVVIWSVLFAGRMAPNREVWVNAVRSGKPVVVLEVGALKRGASWKVGIGGINRKAQFVKPFEENRFENFGINLDPWKTGEGLVTLFTQRPDSQQWEGMCSVEEWCANTITQIRKHTDRQILIRPHPRDNITDWTKLKDTSVHFAPPQKTGHDKFDHEKVFQLTYAAINHSSGPSIQSAIAGIHTICSSESLAYDVSETIENIETPQNKDRSEWLQMLSHTEWFVPEIQKGIPLCHLKKLLTTK